MTGRRAALIVLLLAAFLAGNRIRLTRGLEYFDPANGDCFFWTEGAVQFRYARMVAEGATIPARDPALQWPEGIEPRKRLCLLMERTVGASYRAFSRLFGRPPFHVWAAYAPHVVAALGVPAAYLAGAAVWSSVWAALLAAALYAFSLATVGRAIGSFGHEDFALPWLFLSAAFLLRVVRGGAAGAGGVASAASAAGAPGMARRIVDGGRRIADGALAGLFLALGLGSWHFSRFVYLLIVLALGARLFAADGAARERAARALAWATAGALAACLVFPVLRGSSLPLSPSFLLSVALLTGAVVETRLFPSRNPTPPGPRAFARRAVTTGLVLAALLGGARVVSQTETEDYAHVYALFLAKLRFLGAKPDDPRLLSPEARSLWIEDFSSPSAYLVVATFGVPIALAIAALAGERARRRAAASRRDAPPGDGVSSRDALALLVLLVVLSGTSFLLVKRLFVVLTFFLAALAGGAARRAARARRPGPKARAAGLARLVPAALILFAVGLEAFKFATHGQETAVTRTLRALLKRKPEALTIPNWHANDLATVAWIRNHTEADAAFVGRIGSSPMILTYAGRPIVLQPKYEVPAIRARARAFGAALYGSESDLYRFCREHGAAYYLHEARSALESGPDSERYVGCATRLSKASAAFRLQFAGEASRFFEPLYRNLSYSVYRLAAPEDTAAATGPSSRPQLEALTPEPVALPPHDPLPPQPLCEIVRFGGQSLNGEFFDDRSTPRVVAEMERSIALFVAGQSQMATQLYDRARAFLEESRAINPSLPGVNTYLGLAHALAGDYRVAFPLCAQEIAVSPDLSLAYANLGFVEGNLGMYAEARAHLERAIAIEPGNQGPRAMLAQVEAAAAKAGAH